MENRITPAGAGKTAYRLYNPQIPEDHPRRCGENTFDVSVADDGKGSPPQVRGKRHIGYKIRRFQRITPAGAGKTELFGNSDRFNLDHPRRCGENISCNSWILLPSGSPPQVRGKRSPLKPLWSLSRITPAGAGKTVLPRGRQPQNGDHPRRCGENCEVQSGFTPAEGSPPQVRGKLIKSVCVICRHRITPAGAGKTCLR